jgi:hypothetical protein
MMSQRVNGFEKNLGKWKISPELAMRLIIIIVEFLERTRSNKTRTMLFNCLQSVYTLYAF